MNGNWNDEFLTQDELMRYASKEDWQRFILGACIYGSDTKDGRHVFTLKKARKLTDDEVVAVIDFMVTSDSTDVLSKGKAAISFENILKAWSERITPEERADTERSWQEFSRKYLSQQEG